MRSKEERVNNIYRKVTIYKKEKKNKLKKLYCSTSILICIIVFSFIKYEQEFNKYGLEIDENDINNFSEPNQKLAISMDSIPSIIYNGEIYTFSGNISCKNVLGEYLGSASGSMTNKDESKMVFASIVAKGEIYSVNGYGKDFRICIYDEKNSNITLYDNLDDNNLKIGSDLYGKLFIKNNYVDVLYQLHSDYMKIKDNYIKVSELSKNDIDEFIDALYKSQFVTMTNEEEVTKIPNYDTEGDKIAHLYFKMNDGTTISLTLYINGYILYKNMVREYVYVEDKIFNKIFKSITSD